MAWTICPVFETVLPRFQARAGLDGWTVRAGDATIGTESMNESEGRGIAEAAVSHTRRVSQLVLGDD